MKRFLCVMLFVVCLLCFSACTLEVGADEVVTIMDSIWEKICAFFEMCWVYIVDFIEGIKAQYFA